MLALAAGVSGCKGDKASAAAAAPTVDPEIESKEDDLLARRDSLVKARQRIRAEREELDRKRVEVVKTGGDTAAIDEAAASLAEREASLSEQEAELVSMHRDLVRERRELTTELTAGASAAERAAAREERAATREERVARRERELAEREKQLAEREAALARREEETCGAGAATTTIIKTVDAKGTTYTKKDVEPLLAKARSKMAKNGILPDDLPDHARDLDSEANKAMEANDYGTARLAAQQYYKVVSAIRIDKTFIAGKIARLNSMMEGKKLSSSTRKKVDELFREATSDYGDGKFANANKKLNKIYNLIK